MFRFIRHQIRNFTTKNPKIPIPPAFQRVGNNLPFDIQNKNALTLKFIIFFSSAFYLPFAVLHFQMHKCFPENTMIEDANKSKPEIYGLPDEGEKNKFPELYI